MAGVLLLFSGGVALAGPGLDQAVGNWAGTAAESTPGLTESGPIKLAIARDGAGFRATADLGALGTFTGSFAPSERAGVYESVAQGMFAIFSKKTPPNPLQGGSLIWARETEQSLVLYRLDLPEGRMQLDQLTLRAGPDALEFVLAKRTNTEAPQRLTATLQRVQVPK